MDAQALTLAGATLLARASGALWWEEARLLCVADLHLGRSERLARRGGTLLPPYETQATLDRLEAEIAALAPARVICLGDSFDDGAAGAALAPEAAGRLAALAAARRWDWVAGNHDPGAPPFGGPAAAAVRIGSLVFRHAAESGTTESGADAGEVSGHYHPKLRLALGPRRLSRPCFLLDARRLILPAFGAYTGGLDASHPTLAALLAPDARAITTGHPCVTLPLAAAAPKPAGGRLRIAPRATG